ITRGPPTPQWPFQASGIFSVQSFYQQLCTQDFPGWCDFPASVIWKAGVPTKITGFVWQVFHRRSVSHLFLSCSFASRVWTIFSSKLAIWGPFPSEVQVFIRSWQARNSLRRVRYFEEVALHAIFWFLWL
ncbi:hypothetical protein LINPERHAP1_LOCUS875, partial [Linum perenne]